jgi:hypothetical protein
MFADPGVLGDRRGRPFRNITSITSHDEGA